MASLAQTRSRVRTYHLLGAEDGLAEDPAPQSQQQQQEAEPQEGSLPAEELTVSTSDPGCFPEHVWAAAAQCSDEGRAVLGAYRQLQELRTAYQVQLASLAEPSAWSGSQTHSSQQTLLQSGRQLFEPGSNKKTLPPLTQTAAAGQLLSNNRTGTHSPHNQTQGKIFNTQSTYSQAVFATSERRKLALFEGQKEVWQQVEGLLAARTHRPAQELAMSRGAEHRRKLETVDMLERSMPLEDRCGGPEVWNMSLRNAWERVVPLGSLFSGLTVTIRTTPPYTDKRASREDAAEKLQQKARERVLKIGQPLEPPPLPPVHVPAHRSVFDKSALMGRSLTRRGRDWMNGEVLRTRLEQYAEAINRQFPYKPEMPSLLVTGQSLAASLAASLTHPVTLTDILSHLHTANPAAYDELQAICERLGHAADTADADALAAAGDACDAAADARASSADRGESVCQPGIHLSCSHQSVLLHCSQGQEDREDIVLANKGTVALRYKWVERPTVAHPLAHAVPGGSAGTQQQGNTPFHMLQCEGVILPGETATASVCFKPSTAGLFHASWCLETVPVWPGACEPIVLEVQGSATVPPARGPQRQALERQLNESEKTAKVQAALERILASAGPQPPRPQPESPEEEAACMAWDAANTSLWPPVYYPGPAAVQEAHDIYTAARAALVQVLQPPVSPDPAGKKPAAAKGGKGAAPVEEAAPIITWPETWSLSVSALEHLLAELEAAEATAAAAAQPPADAADSSAATRKLQSVALKARLAKLLASQSVRVPRDSRVLLRHAVRAALLRAVDAVDEKLEAVRSEYDQRVAEAAASEGKVQPPTAQWLADKNKTGVKAQVKTLIPNWWEQIAKEKSVIADWVESALSHLAHTHNPQAHSDPAQGASGEASASEQTAGSTQPAEGATSQEGVSAAAGPAGQGAEVVVSSDVAHMSESHVSQMSDEEYHWATFALLREWVRLGLPARPAVSS